MKNWKIEFFNEKVMEETYSLPPKAVAKLIHLLELLEIVGAREPYTKHIGNGLFEIRIKTVEGIARCIFCYQKGQTIVILHSFVKKTKKIPQKEYKLALKRKKELENEQS